MNTKRNKKLCLHCEGEIDKDAIYCLYCGQEVGGQNAETPEPPYQSAAVQKEEAVAPATTEAQPILSFTLLLVGAYLFVFSLFLLFFSEDGVLSLKWDASFWFVYLLAGIPALFFGFRKLK